MADFYIKQNDTSPTFEATLLDADGAAVDYTGALSVNFHMTTAAGATLVDAAMVETAPLTGVVSYFWNTGDTATAGTHNAEIELTFADGKIQTFPNFGFWKVEVSEELL